MAVIDAEKYPKSQWNGAEWENQFLCQQYFNRLYCYLNGAEPIIWAGDHNIATNPTLDRHPAVLTRDHGTREFLELTETFDFKDACRTLYPNQKYYTFRRGSSKSRIDKICLSSTLNATKYEHTDTSFSDNFWSQLLLDFQLNKT